MYDPTVGRWLTTDPIGFSAEDMNLYRYVHNGATNLTDPTGCDDLQPFGKNGKLKLTTNLSATLKNNKIPFGTCGATISVTKEDWQLLDDASSKTEHMNFAIKLGAGAKPADRALFKKTQWLQMYKADRYTDAAGKTLDNSGEWERPIRAKITDKDVDSLRDIKFGKWAVDGPILTSPYMTDNEISANKRTDDSLNFWDAPKMSIATTKKYPLIIVSFKACLVVDGKLAYVIEWTATNKFIMNKVTVDYKLTGGDVPKVLPAELKDANLYQSSTLTGTRTIKNPVTGVVPPPKGPE